MTEVIVLAYDNKLQTGVSIVTDLSHVEESELSLLFSPESSLIDHKWSSRSFMCYVSPPSVPWAFDHFLTPLQKICKITMSGTRRGTAERSWLMGSGLRRLILMTKNIRQRVCTDACRRHSLSWVPLPKPLAELGFTVCMS